MASILAINGCDRDELTRLSPEGHQQIRSDMRGSNDAILANHQEEGARLAQTKVAEP